MFTKKVTDDDNFMSLSSSAQALYLHLSMSADDDGFCNQVNSSMFKAHASVQDLEALLTKRCVYQFDNGVIVIKHWRMANALRKDRYTPTVFQEELAKLKLKENGAYSWLPDGCQMVAERLPQDRIEKKSIGEGIKEKECKERESPAEEDVFAAFAATDTELLKALRDFESMRKKIRKPMTGTAKKMLVNKLKKEFNRSEWVTALNEAEANCWLTVYKHNDGIRGKPGNGGKSGGGYTALDELRQIHAEYEREESGAYDADGLEEWKT